EQKINKLKLNRAEIKQTIIDWLLARNGTAYAVDMERMYEAVLPEPIRTMVINGYHKQRSGVIQLIMQPGWYDGYAITGTTHRSWNPYDTHIPLLWYGWKINKSEEHTSELQSRENLVCRLLLEKKKDSFIATR